MSIQHLNFGQNKNLFGHDMIHLNRDGSKLLATNLFLGVLYRSAFINVGCCIFQARDAADVLIPLDSKGLLEFCIAQFQKTIVVDRVSDDVEVFSLQ